MWQPLTLGSLLPHLVAAAQVVDEIYDAGAAAAMSIERVEQVRHTSTGLGGAAKPGRGCTASSPLGCAAPCSADTWERLSDRYTQHPCCPQPHPAASYVAPCSLPACLAALLGGCQVVVMIHTGSRGLGHQVCTNALAACDRAVQRAGIKLVDRQLACMPIQSAEGRDYLAAMAAAANFAFCNRCGAG